MRSSTSPRRSARRASPGRPGRAARALGVQFRPLGHAREEGACRHHVRVRPARQQQAVVLRHLGDDVVELARCDRLPEPGEDAPRARQRSVPICSGAFGTTRRRNSSTSNRSERLSTLSHGASSGGSCAARSRASPAEIRSARVVSVARRARSASSRFDPGGLHDSVDEGVVVHGPGCSPQNGRVNRRPADAAVPEPPLPVAREEDLVGDEEQAGDEEHGQAHHAQKTGCRPVEPEHEHEPGHEARQEHPASARRLTTSPSGRTGGPSRPSGRAPAAPARSSARPARR